MTDQVQQPWTTQIQNLEHPAWYRSDNLQLETLHKPLRQPIYHISVNPVPAVFGQMIAPLFRDETDLCMLVSLALSKGFAADMPVTCIRVKVNYSDDRPTEYWQIFIDTFSGDNQITTVDGMAWGQVVDDINCWRLTLLLSAQATGGTIAEGEISIVPACGRQMNVFDAGLGGMVQVRELRISRTNAEAQAELLARFNS